MKKPLLMKQKGFNQLPEIGPELVVDRDGKRSPCPSVDGNLPYVGCDFGSADDITAYTIFYDCQHCHGSGCDICGGTGRSLNPVNKEDAYRYFRLGTSPRVFPELKFKNGEFEK